MPACWNLERRIQNLELRTRHGVVATLIAVLFAPIIVTRAQQPSPSGDIALKPTSHPKLPAELSQLWLAPVSTARPPALDAFATGVKLEVDSNFARALPIFQQPAVRQGPLGHYAEYLRRAGAVAARPSRGGAPDVQGAGREKSRPAISSRRRRCAKRSATRRSTIRARRWRSTSVCRRPRRPHRMTC